MSCPRDNLEAALRTLDISEDQIRAIKAGDVRATVFSEGAFRIAKERIRQIVVEEWGPEHDDRHVSGELAVEAASLAVYGTDAAVDDGEDLVRYDDDEPCDQWGLIQKHRDDPIRMLEIAGALIAAELDRLLRARHSEPSLITNRRKWKPETEAGEGE